MHGKARVPIDRGCVVSRSVHSLVDAVVKAYGLAEQGDDWELVAADAIGIAELGAADFAAKGRSEGLAFTAAHDAPIVASLETLIALPINGAGDATLHVVDGWAAIRMQGHALDLRGARLTMADLSGADLRGADLSEADLSRANLTKADLTGATLVGACFSGATLFSASLKNADLTEADFCRSDLRHVDFRGVTCRRAAFRGADFWGTYMWKVDVSEAFLQGADLTRSDYLVEKVQS